MPHPPGPEALRAILLATIVAGCGSAQAQKIDDVPPAVQNNVPPNFMFMIDNSGSMKNIVVAAPYDRGAQYLASCPLSARVDPASGTINVAIEANEPYFRIGNSSTNVRHQSINSASGKCFDNAATYGAKLLAVTTSGTRVPDGSYTDADYSGHFLNWYFGNYAGPVTGWSDRKPGTETRMEVARRVARDAVAGLPLPGPSGRPVIRIGLSTYRDVRSGNNGGALRVPMSDLTATVQTQVRDSIRDMPIELFTPLASTLADIGRYLASGYGGNITLQRTTDAVPQSVNIDTVFKVGLDTLSGPQGTTRNACLLGAPSCSSTSSPKPVQYWCQRSSIFAVTDGRPNLDRAFRDNEWIRDYDGDCTVNKTRCQADGALDAYDRKRSPYTYEDFGSDYMDDVAKLLFDVDLRPDLVKRPATPTRPQARNNVRTYMIGFADAAVQADPLLMNTAAQGGGRFIAAAEGEALRRGFDEVISDAQSLDAAAAAVAVTSAQVTDGTVGFASGYVSGSWYGDLEAYSLDVNTGLQNGATLWSAKQKLKDFIARNGHGARRIASFGSSAVAFRPAAMRAALVAATGLPDVQADALIDYTRGSAAAEGSTFRRREFPLGDVINAEPVVVNYPGSGAVVFQAANDGMLHAFDGRVTGTTAGEELWAYVPGLVLGKLPARARPAFFEHQFLVDATPAVAEISVGSVRRLLVGGLGKGGAGYYALDITSGTAATEADAVAKVLWEARPANMGYSFGTPLIVNTAAGWRVVVASGYRNDGASGGVGGDGRGHVWVLNPANGQVVKEFLTPSGFGSASDPLGLAFLAKPQNLAADAVVRYVYGGDLKGNVWRIDLNARDGAAPVRIAALTDPSGNPQPVTSAPVVAPVTGSATRLMVYVGTGQYFSVDDVPGTPTPNAAATQKQTIYGIVDDTAVATPTLPNIRGSTGATCPTSGPGAGGNGALVCQGVLTAGALPVISHNPVDLSTKRGFYLDIPIANGRVNTQPALTAGGTLVAIVNVPTNATCDPGGSSYMFQLSGTTGGAVLKRYGGSDYFQSVFKIADALSSRSVIVTTGTGRRGLERLSDRGTESIVIGETAGTAPGFRRIYMRPLN